MLKEIQVPPLGESVTEATVARWLKDPGEHVAADETVIELETDKITLEVHAPVAGILQEVHFGKGSRVKVGDILGTVAGNSDRLSQQAQDKAKPDVLEQRTEDIRVKTSPAVGKMIAESGVNPLDIKGTGKKGRLIREDVINYLETRDRDLGPEVAKPVVPASSPYVVPVSTEERVPMSRLRQRVAERLKDAQNTAAMLTTFNEVDMTEVMALRNHYRENFEKKHGVRLGFMSFFVKACITALKEIPAVNAEIDGEDIIYKHHYDIGVAVSAPRGLVVPVVRGADSLGFADIERKIAELGQKARDNKLSMEDLSGGTFTITNGGIFGSLMSTPILNPPQSGILGMHKIQERPVAVQGKVEIRPMMYIALTYDHRLIDGREAVTFLVRVKECIENPERLLLDI